MFGFEFSEWLKVLLIVLHCVVYMIAGFLMGLGFVALLGLL